MRHILFLLLVWNTITGCNLSSSTELSDNTVSIVVDADATSKIKQAAQEVRRYVYLRTKQLLPITRPASSDADQRILIQLDHSLASQAYNITSDSIGVVISGGNEQGVLYGAYAFAEKLGVYFDIHSDVIPDKQINLKLDTMQLEGNPIFSLRGTVPFHDFFEGPDWWNADDYKAYFTQLAKMKMNFVGLHSYPWYKPWTHVSPEPGVWVGLSEDLDEKGHVKFSYRTSWANTARPGPGISHSWGHTPEKTSGF